VTRPTRFLARMISFLAVVALAATALSGPLRAAFLANPALNGVILGVLGLGILYVFRQVWMLGPAAHWIDAYRRTGDAAIAGAPPNLLAPVATILGAEQGRRALSPLSSRSLLDALRSRLDESGEISRYLVGLLIFLGLLGTFWGLLEMIRAVGGTIAGLDTASGDVERFLADLREGLESPLHGMSTAFSSSLFGLAGSLVLGFLDLTAGQAQNRFANELEDWLASLTRLGSVALRGEGEGMPAYLEALLEQSADNVARLEHAIENLRAEVRLLSRTLASSEPGRR
jgi:signal transduction histidine kinase